MRMCGFAKTFWGLMLWLLLVAAMAGCNSNPYSDKPETQPEKPAAPSGPSKPTQPSKPPTVVVPNPVIPPVPDPNTPEPPAPPPQPPPVLSLAVDDVMDFVEGQDGQYPVRAQVSAPGKAMLEFVGLPKGMNFDSGTGFLKWTPNMEDANDPKNPMVVEKNSVITVRLYSDKDPKSILQKHVLIVVRDFPRKFQFMGQPAEELSFAEGQTWTQTIRFLDEDFPTGPFQVMLLGLPTQVKLQANAGQPEFTLQFAPEYGFAPPAGLVFKGEIQVIDPRGRVLRLPQTWNVKDVRLSPILAGPAEAASQGSSVRFFLFAEDPNGDELPAVDFVTRPGFGKAVLTPTRIAQAGNPRLMVQVDWSEIPKEKFGTMETLTFKACTSAAGCTNLALPVRFNKSDGPSSPSGSTVSWKMAGGDTCH